MEPPEEARNPYLCSAEWVASRCLTGARPRCLTRKCAKCVPPIDSSGQIYVCIYIYIYIYCSVKNWSKNCLFFESKKVQAFFFLSFFAFQKSSSFRKENEKGEWDFQKETKKTEITILWVTNWSNYDAQHAWTNFDSTLGRFLTRPFWHFLAVFGLSKYAEATIFVVFSAKMHCLNPPQKLRNTICEHNCANWEKCCFNQHYWFKGFLPCPVFAFSFEVNEKTQQKIKKNNKKETRPQDENKKPLNLVAKKEKNKTDTKQFKLFFKWKQTTQEKQTRARNMKLKKINYLLTNITQNNTRIEGKTMFFIFWTGLLGEQNKQKNLQHCMKITFLSLFTKQKNKYTEKKLNHQKQK